MCRKVSCRGRSQFDLTGCKLLQVLRRERAVLLRGGGQPPQLVTLDVLMLNTLLPQGDLEMFDRSCLLHGWHDSEEERHCVLWQGLACMCGKQLGVEGNVGWNGSTACSSVSSWHLNTVDIGFSDNLAKRLRYFSRRHVLTAPAECVAQTILEPVETWQAAKGRRSQPHQLITHLIVGTTHRRRQASSDHHS